MFTASVRLWFGNYGETRKERFPTSLEARNWVRRQQYEQGVYFVHGWVV